MPNILLHLPQIVVKTLYDCTNKLEIKSELSGKNVSAEYAAARRKLLGQLRGSTAL